MANWSGFYKLPVAERLNRIQKHANLTPEELSVLHAPSALADDATQLLIENATGTMPMPLGWAVGFTIDGAEHVIPMAVEESSVVAAACHGAKIAAAAGGFHTSAMDPVTIGQIEIRGVADAENAAVAFLANHDRWQEQLNGEMPTMVERGGGVRGLTLRRPGDRLVVHVHVDTRDAMGANVVNTACEAIGPEIAKELGGTLGLCILSNLATERLVTAACKIPIDQIGQETAAGIVAANLFALDDPYRAATHNKGIMNGIDPVALATGNDWRAIEAGAHAFAAMDGQYRALTEWAIDGNYLLGNLTLPLSVGVVGGMTRLHPVAAACLKVLGTPSSTELARIMASVGLAQNLAALKALATEGIQRGHMKLHESNRRASA